MKFLYAIFFMFSIINANGSEIFPQNCQPMLVKGETVELTTSSPAIIVIHNLSSMDLWITHPVTATTANAGWSSRIQAGNWSALALTKKKFAISCIESKPGHEQQVPCEGLLGLCQWSKIKFPESEKGTFWAAEDMSLKSLLAHIGSRGFIIQGKKDGD